MAFNAFSWSLFHVSKKATHGIADPKTSLLRFMKRDETICSSCWLTKDVWVPLSKSGASEEWNIGQLQLIKRLSTRPFWKPLSSTINQQLVCCQLRPAACAQDPSIGHDYGLSVNSTRLKKIMMIGTANVAQPTLSSLERKNDSKLFGCCCTRPLWSLSNSGAWSVSNCLVDSGCRASQFQSLQVILSLWNITVGGRDWTLGFFVSKDFWL